MDIVTFQRGDKTALTKNFSLYEFECPCGCTAQMIDRELVEKMQILRDKLGKKVKVTSGYRCVKHNASKDVGGSKQSRHLYGIAADWRTDNRSVNPVALGILAHRHAGRQGHMALHHAGPVPQHHLQCLYPADHQTGMLWSCKPQRNHHAPEAAEGES